MSYDDELERLATELSESAADLIAAPAPQGRRGAPGADGQKGDQGPRGPQGPEGKQGDIGPMPMHEWQGTSLRFQESSEEWGRFVDLRGPSGRTVAVGVTTPPFNLDELPMGDPDLAPEEVAVKQSGVWVRIGFEAFVDLVEGAQGGAQALSIDGQELSLNGASLAFRTQH